LKDYLFFLREVCALYIRQVFTTMQPAFLQVFNAPFPDSISQTTSPHSRLTLGVSANWSRFYEASAGVVEIYQTLQNVPPDSWIEIESVCPGDSEIRVEEIEGTCGGCGNSIQHFRLQQHGDDVRIRYTLKASGEDKPRLYSVKLLAEPPRWFLGRQAHEEADQKWSRKNEAKLKALGEAREAAEEAKAALQRLRLDHVGKVVEIGFNSEHPLAKERYEKLMQDHKAAEALANEKQALYEALQQSSASASSKIPE
jgi:hypothetical protein